MSFLVLLTHRQTDKYIETDRQTETDRQNRLTLTRMYTHVH